MSEFVEVKTQDLSGAALDWAVARAEGLKAAVFPSSPHYVYIDGSGFGCGPYHPHEYWAQGGLLLSKYLIDITVERKDLFFAYVCDDCGMPATSGEVYGCFGPTHLIAACRAIVASVLGETVSVPKELLS